MAIRNTQRLIDDPSDYGVSRHHTEAPSRENALNAAFFAFNNNPTDGIHTVGRLTYNVTSTDNTITVNGFTFKK